MQWHVKCRLLIFSQPSRFKSRLPLSVFLDGWRGYRRPVFVDGWELVGLAEAGRGLMSSTLLTSALWSEILRFDGKFGHLKESKKCPFWDEKWLF
jgi:hypothetical protein